MSRFLVIANWKMKISPEQEIALADRLKDVHVDTNKALVSLNPSYLSLIYCAGLLNGSNITLGAQDCFWEDAGAYTGEISPEFLKKLGCQNVIVGHSERRQYLGESDVMTNKKILRIIDNDLTPILCVGESKDERDDGNKDHLVRRQVELALRNVAITCRQKILIAYEPIWAIGTGNPAATAEIIYMHEVIYQALLDIFPEHIVQHNIFVLYGGSVDSGNLSDLLKERLIDGVLVGGASLKFEEFRAMMGIANNI